MSSPTTIKHQNFVSEPVKMKPATKVPGIGKAIGGRMSRKGGIKNASQVVGQYLVLNKDQENFEDWIMTFGASAKHARDCHNAIAEYCENLS